MKLIINEQQKDLPVNNIRTLLIALEQPEQGIAIAVNQAIINRQQWDDFQLSENDNISLFQAIAGG